jgi:putative redox protein
LPIRIFVVLRFDYSWIGESEGNFSETTYSDYLDDLIASAEFLRKNYYAPQLLVGHSLGGCAAIEAAKSIASVRALAVIGTSAEPSYLSDKLRKTREKATRQGFAYAEIGEEKFKFSREFFIDLENHRLGPTIRSLKKPLLILHSPVDTYSSIENAAQIFRTAKHPKSFISLDDMST